MRSKFAISLLLITLAGFAPSFVQGMPCDKNLSQIGEDSGHNILRLWPGEEAVVVGARIQAVVEEVRTANPETWAAAVVGLESRGALKPKEVYLLAVNLVRQHEAFLAEQLQDAALVSDFLNNLETSILNPGEKTSNLNSRMVLQAERREDQLWAQPDNQAFRDPHYNRLRDAINLVRVLMSWNDVSRFPELKFTTTAFEEVSRLLSSALTTSTHGIRCTRADGQKCSSIQTSFRCYQAKDPHWKEGQLHSRPEKLCFLWDQRYLASSLVLRNQVVERLEGWDLVLSKAPKRL